MTPESRNARAVEEAAAYRRRLADGTAEPLEDFLAKHEDLRDLLEPMIDEAMAVTESIAAAQEAGIATMLPDALQQEILAIHAGSSEVRADEMAALCDRHPEQADDIRALLSVLEGTEKRVQASARATSGVPEQIGPYRILSVLGEGGMGTVYLAEQTEPIRRKVALKVIKLGMDSAMVLRRFEAERQALAMMEHTNIARVYEAGTTDRGQPYFAMEYVKGQPITKFCDHHKLSLEERLNLFQQICSGVQHAHQKGVIHRDLTPRNVLVTTEDGQPTPKIIDFGIARATDHRLVEATLFTEQGQIIGTPEYMSPEQAGLNELDIDTRSDIYTLGVLLYDLLVGELPFPSRELREAGLVEMERKIREDDPPKPSTRLTASVHSGDIAKLRGMDLRSLQHRLKGDLDWIVMKALEKDRTRRYETAAELSQDLRRYLSLEPVLAGPPSLRYRTAKFVRRYRGRVIAASAVFLMLLAGVVGTTLNMLEAQANFATVEVLTGGSRLLRAQIRLDELDRLPPWPDQIDVMNAWIEIAEALEGELPQLNRELEKLRVTAVRSAGQAEQMLDDEDSQSRLERLETLRSEVTRFLETHLPRIRDRLSWAEGLERLTIDHPDADFTWDAARDAIEKADDETASYLYALSVEPINLQPQLGLVPLGPDPVSKLWEFYHLRSAADQTRIPRRKDGRFEVTPEMGIIFVLIPGEESLNTFAQNDDPDQINYVQSAADGDRTTVDLEPYFLSKYEMTQAQWKRLSSGETPSYYYEGYTERSTGEPETVTGAHPVENVTWSESRELAVQHGLRLPTDVEWEYGCRAGTRTKYYTGEEDSTLEGHANVLDETGEKTALPSRIGAVAPFDDGFGIHAPVGSLKPNPWGLHDVHGNILEWCEDLYGPPYRVTRGGSLSGAASISESEFRNDWNPLTTNFNFGVRPARDLVPGREQP